MQLTCPKRIKNILTYGTILVYTVRSVNILQENFLSKYRQLFSLTSDCAASKGYSPTHSTHLPTGVNSPLYLSCINILDPSIGQSVEITGTPSAIASMRELGITTPLFAIFRIWFFFSTFLSSEKRIDYIPDISLVFLFSSMYILWSGNS